MNFKFKFKEDILMDHLEYSNSKHTANIFKKMILGFMGGVFIACGFIAYLTVTASGSEGWLKLLGSLVFPCGIILCIFLGGNLFTGNCLIYTGVLKKKIKRSHFYYDLSITWLFNAFGGITIALIAWGAGLFSIGSSVGSTLNDIGGNTVTLAVNKIAAPWYASLLSGFLCNLLVCGAIWCYNNTTNKILGLMVLYSIIVIFALSGYNHVVANFFLLPAGGFASLAPGVENWSADFVGKIFYQNLIPTTIGNLLSGLLIPLIYMFVGSLTKPGKHCACANVQEPEVIEVVKKSEPKKSKTTKKK